MPDWQADSIILSVRPHGEGSAVISVLTNDYGRHAGLVRGGAASNMRGIIQPGNRVRVSWRARLSEQLGQMQIELVQSVPALLLDSPLRLSGVASMFAGNWGCWRRLVTGLILLDALLAVRPVIWRLSAQNQAVRWRVIKLAALPAGCWLCRCSWAAFPAVNMIGLPVWI